MSHPIKSLFSITPFEPESHTRTLKLLNVFLQCLEGASGLIILLYFVFWRQNNSLIIIGSATLLLSFGLHYLLKKGYSLLVRWLIPLFILPSITASLLLYGSVRSVLLPAYFYILALVALVLGETAMWFFGGLILLYFGGAFYADVQGLLVPIKAYTDWFDLLLFVITWLIMSLLLRAAVREVTFGFQRARKHAAELDALNNELEQRVQDRTAELDSANQELRTVKERLEYLISFSPTIIYSGRTSGDYGTTYISPNVTHLLGYAPAEFIQDPRFWANRIHPEDASKLFEDFLETFERGYRVNEYRFKHHNGTYRWLRDEVRVIRDQENHPPEIIGSWIDITEQKNSDLARQASEQRYRILFENSLDGILLTRPTGEILFANPAACELLGYSETELRGIPCKQVIDPADGRLAGWLERRTRYERARGELTFRRKDGTLFEGEVSSTLFQNADSELQTSMFIRDVTENRRAEQALRRSEALLNTTNQIARIGGWELNLQTDELYWTDSVKEIHEVPLGYVPNLTNGINFYVPEHIPIIHTAIEGALAGKPYDIELQIHTARGKRLWVRAMGRPIYENDQIVKLMGVFQDIHAHKLAQEALRQSENNLQEAQRIAKLGNFSFDLHTNAVTWSDEIYRIYGLPPKHEMTLEQYQSLIAPQDYQRVMEAVSETIATHAPYMLEHEIVTPTGEHKHLMVIGRLLLDETGHPARIFGIAQDITERKKAEFAIRERETLYRALFEQSYDGVMLHNVATGTVVAANQAIANLLECHPEDLLGNRYTDNISPEDIPDSHTRWTRTIQEGHHPPYERHVITRKGHHRIFEVTTSTIYDDTGTPRYNQAVLRDMTARKEAEHQTQAALQEKEILLKEIHHRVKNNLQVISSLLYLQAQKIKDEQSLELFRESQNRVAAMALVHEQLYQSNNFARVDFVSYTRTLLHTLFESYGVDRTRITFEVKSDGSTIDIHTAIPCGLLLSEMVSNTLKYAFPDHRPGHLTLAFHLQANTYHLEVQDDGVGIHPSSHLRPGSLGLQLIDRLVAQIGGTLTRQGPPGTAYSIQFPHTGKK